MTESSQTYFEDMWLALEKELSEYDSYHSYYSNNFSGTLENLSSPTINQPSDFLAQTSNSLDTYEKLLDLQNTNPSPEQFHSPNLQDRINAIRDIYNKETTIIIGRVDRLSNRLKKLSATIKVKKQGSTLLRAHRVAQSLHRKGLVAEGNKIENLIEQVVSQNFSYSTDNGKLLKRIEYNKRSNTPAQIRVQISDPKSATEFSKQFDNILEALDFFTQNTYEF